MVAADVWSLLSAYLNEVGNKSLFGAFFELKKSQIRKIISQKTRLKQIGEPSLFLTENPITLFVKILTIFSKINEDLVKNYGKCE